ncbi:unnamed protein product [Mytilus edulis]|uniref:CCHC-type domain-containing protein n=2 Tax=Mytilus TaxID=6548 RepID=A0A8B6H5R1_MYTGA|nr:unnamed protein product [Mytilus edulis]VDI74296.1 Hypothetical predicted protein [Mytilus galloprovincialis]
MADAGRNSPDPEINFRMERDLNLDDLGQGDQIHTDDNDDFDRESILQGHGDEVDQRHKGRDEYQRHDFDDRNGRGNHNMQPIGPPKVTLKPEPFSGKDCWEEYLSHFEDCAELGQWGNRTKLLFLAASLRGQARTYYMSLSAGDRRTYQMLTQKLDQRFGSSKHKNRWLSKLEMRRRMAGESIAEVGDDIRQLAQKAYYDLDLAAQESLALNQLFKVITVEMKCRCIDKECHTIADAVDVIERYESILGDQDKKKSTMIRAVESKDTEGHMSEKDYHSNLQELQDRIAKLEQGHGSRESKRANTGRCYGCNSPDHFMRNCPHKNNQRARGNFQGNQRQNTSFNHNQGNDRTLAQ